MRTGFDAGDTKAARNEAFSPAFGGMQNSPADQRMLSAMAWAPSVSVPGRLAANRRLRFRSQCRGWISLDIALRSLGSTKYPSRGQTRLAGHSCSRAHSAWVSSVRTISRTASQRAIGESKMDMATSTYLSHGIQLTDSV